MKDLMAGGACNPTLATNSGNAFRNFMGSMGSAGQHFGLQSGVSVDQNLAGVMQKFNMAWEHEQEIFRAQEIQRQMVMQKMWAEENMKQEALAKELTTRSAVAERAWMKSEGSLVNNNWHGSFIAPVPIIVPVQTTAPQKEAPVIVEKNQDLKNLEDTSKADFLIDTMMNDPDPKFQESEFLAFVKKMRSGEYEITDNVLTIHPEKKVEFDNVFNKHMENMESYLDAAMKEADPESAKLLEEMRRANLMQEVRDEKTTEKSADPQETLLNEIRNADPIGAKVESLWDDLMQNYDESDPEAEKKLLAFWESKAKEYEAAAEKVDISKQWNMAQNIDFLEQRTVSSNYKFQETNPYSETSNPLEALVETLQKGDSFQTRLVLEAHLQKHADDIQGWKSLGLLQQELNQDQSSASCFLKALELNPKDPWVLLQLGVSCANVFDELQSFMYLERWLNPDGPLILNEEDVKNKEWTGKDIMNVKQQIREKFMVQQNRGDINWFLASGVANYLCREYEEAATLFKQATLMDPNDHFLWNKVGAALTQMKDLDGAQTAYHKALDLRPNYLRTWTNLAVTYNSRMMYSQAAAFFLNSLALNPQSLALWSHLESSFIMAQDNESLAKIHQRDINLFADKHNIKRFDDLPEPEGLGHVDIFQKYFVQSDLGEWISKFSSHPTAPGEPTSGPADN